MTTAAASHPVSDGSEGPSILVVDDDPTFRERLARAFRTRGLEVRVAAGFEDGLASVTADAPELAVLDLRMPGKSGLELLKAIKAIDPETRVVVLTGYGSIASAVEAMRCGAVHYLQKPADADQILAAFSPELEEEADPKTPRPLSLARAEWELIQSALTECDGNISAAARRLGLHRRTLQRKLLKHPPS
jgi:two-component system, response regulator RegA